ncbi:hydrogenase maturation nickel metallochaperone HypA [Halomonas nitroreducens]|uniref:Hydrogenase maturation factor HypA n=1 Tax=Halomonas nitroreducens TaxID=447425 RepID=A0A431V0T6_9GAMM|nr:hydrogenase maturation nickel metallochaperone HypA [Halomonas nitroreducens]RTR01103.1 hydrogenase maturation nickel metallochaperone HypA [Halomonas nitroreducens]
MHELGLCRSLVDQACRVAERHGATRIRRIRLRVGPLSGVEPALMQTAFPLAGRHTAAEGARLEMIPCSIRVHCPACGRESTAHANDLGCPHCGEWCTRLVAGDELLLESVGLATDTPAPDVQEAPHV